MRTEKSRSSECWVERDPVAAHLSTINKICGSRSFNLRTPCPCKFPNNTRSRFRKSRPAVLIYPWPAIGLQMQIVQLRNASVRLSLSLRQTKRCNGARPGRGSPFSQIKVPPTSSVSFYLRLGGKQIRDSM